MSINNEGTVGDYSAFFNQLLMEEELEEGSLAEENFNAEIDMAIRHIEELDRIEMEEREREAALETVVEEPPIPQTEEDAEGLLDFLEEDLYGSKEQPASKKKAEPKVEEKPPERPLYSLKAKTEFHDMIVSIARAVLGDDNVDLIRSHRTDAQGVLILIYPHINIRNKRGETHEITDMVVGLPIRYGSFSDYIMGTRLSMEQIEYVSGYYHSHLTASAHDLSTFCTGSDGINDLWASLKMDGYHSGDFDIRFEGFIHQMEAFLSYESLEGVPYQYIKNISFQHRRDIGTAEREDNVRMLLNSNDVQNQVELSYDFNSGKISLIETDQLHSVMAMVATVHQYRMPNGTYVSDEDLAQEDMAGFYMENGFSATINGKERRLYVKPFSKFKLSEQKEQKRRYAHGRIVNSFKSAIEDRGNKLLLDKCLQKYSNIEDEKEREIGAIKRFNRRNSVSLVETIEPGVVRTTVLETEQGGESRKTRDDSN